MGNSHPFRTGEKVYETAEQYDSMDPEVKKQIISSVQKSIKRNFDRTNHLYHIYNSILKIQDDDNELKFFHSYTPFVFDETVWLRTDILHNIIDKILKEDYHYTYVLSISYNDQKIRPRQLFVKYSIVQFPRGALLTPDTVTQDYRSKSVRLGLQFPNEKSE